MRKTSRGIAALVGVLSVLAISAVAVAASPHFIGTPSATVSGNSLTVSFSAAGLGNATGATFTLEGPVTVNSRCYTKSGNTPQAANKQETVNVSTTETFPVRNGRTNGSFTVSPLSTLQCPGGQRVVIESVDFSNLVLSGEGLTFNF
jgi:hypothetical protein